MKEKKSTGKRGRPRKHPIVEKIKSDIKRGRGRPPKTQTTEIENTDNIVIRNKGSGMTTYLLEHPEISDVDYKEPKILRNIRVFRLDRSVFHTFSKKFNGDIITMSYVLNELIDQYLNKKIKLDEGDKSFKYYQEWWKGSPGLEPIGLNDIAQASAVLRGIPLQYKYSFIIDRNIYDKLENRAECYPQFIVNLLIKMYLNEENKINIDIKKAIGWCNFG